VTLPTAAPRLRPGDLLATFSATGIAFLLAGAATQAEAAEGTPADG
jgi:hypothetical protein